MIYCRMCCQPDTRPNSQFTPDGECPACNYFQRVRYIDWEDRFEILQKLIKKNRRSRLGKSRFDCVIGVSGGKDSSRQAMWVRDKLGLKPLLVCLSYPPEQVTERGTNNISNLINLGFDVVISAPSPMTWKSLMRASFEKYTNWARSTELALFSAVPQIAIHYGIQLIFWGENPGLQLGDLKTLGRNGYDGNNLRNMNTLSGGSFEWMLDAGYPRKNLIPYWYPTPEEFDQHQLQIVYLGWFLGDWSLINNGKYAVLDGLETRTANVASTGDLHGVTSLDEDWVAVNQLIKYYKFGFGRASDYVNEEIRLNRVSRNEGIALVEKYDDACGTEYIEAFSKYIGISTDAFWIHVTKAVNRRLFDVKDDGTIVKKFKVGVGL